MTATSKTKRKSNIKEKRNRLRKARAAAKSKPSEKKKTGAPKSTEDEKMVKNTSSIVNFLKDTTQTFINKTKVTSPPPGQYEMQELQKAEKELEIAKLSQSEEEIAIAMENLETAKKDKDEFDKYQEAKKKSPRALLDYLNNLLQSQTAEKAHSDIISNTVANIQMVKENIKNTEDLEKAGTKESQISLSDEESDGSSKSSETMEIEIDDNSETSPILPSIPYQQCYDDISNSVTQEESKENDISDEELDEGQKTPISSGSHTSPTNLIQTKLNNVLKVITPQEKMKQIRLQAKLNANKVNEQVETQKQKANEESIMINDKKMQSESKKSSANEDGTICENIEAINEISSQASSANASINDDDSKYSEKDNENESQSSNQNESSKKTKQTKISIARTYAKYYSIKLKVEKANVPVQQLIKHLKLFYKQLQRIDPSMVIYAYNNEIPTEAILKPNDMPNDISVLKKFFMNISVKPMGGHTWFQVWLGHDDSVSNIIENMKYWSSEQDTYMYQKRLQHKYSVKEYWLMWSAERMDPTVLHQEVCQIISKYTKTELHFSFSFGNIRKDPRYSSTKSTTKFNKAMIIEAKKEQKEEIYFVMGKIFSSNSKFKIMGMNMRLVPMMQNDLPSHTKMKVTHLICKQEQYLSMLRVKTCVYLQEIDYFNTALNTTLRDIIMQLETLHTFDKNGDPMKVFINVDYSSWHSCYLLTYPSHLEKEAEDYITQLPAFLHYVYGPEVLLMLTAEGQAKAQSSSWDPEKLCATSSLDLELDAVANESNTLAWLPDLKSELIHLDTTNMELKNKIYDKATDADSISTFQSNTNPINSTSIVSPSPNESNERNSSSTSHHQTRESNDSDNGNTTSKEAASSLGGSL